MQAEEDKRTLREAQAKEREEAVKKPSLYAFGLPDDVLLLVLPHLDARNLARAARVCFVLASFLLLKRLRRSAAIGEHLPIIAQVRMSVIGTGH